MGTLYRNGIPYVGSGGAGGVEVTQAEYDALPESEKLNGSIYFITDGSVSYPTASQMRYDNTESGIPSTSVQGAIDELKIDVDDLNDSLSPLLTAPLLCWRNNISDANSAWRSGIYGTNTSTVGVNDYGVLLVISNADRSFDGQTWYFQILITTSGVIKSRQSINQTSASGWTAWKTFSLT